MKGCFLGARASRPRFFGTIVLSLLAVTAFAQQPAAKKTTTAAPREWNQIKFPQLRDVKLPDIKRYTLENGIRLFVVEDHRLPLVDGFAMLRTGSRWEPAEKTGLASITGNVMRTGGTKTKTGDQLDEELEAIAASVETGISLTSGSASFSALKGDEDKALAIFADVLMNPEFRQDKIDLAKNFARTSIERRNDDPGDINAREFRKLLYGPQSAYGRHTEYSTIEAVRRDDLIQFHRRFYHPNNVMIGISGDVNAEEIRQKVEKAFAAWKPAPQLQIPPLPDVRPPAAAAVNFVRKTDVNQTSVRIGHIDGLIKDPDYFALDVMAEILAAGGFSSRITKKVRSQMGLAYAAGGDWAAEYDYPGSFSIFVGTKSESTVTAIEAVLAELRKIREAEVTDEELRIAKESILNSFVFNFVQPAQVMRRIMTYIYFGYPENFLDQYKENVEKVTKADVLRVAQKHVQPDRVTILAVGNDKEFDKPLSQLALAGGKVNTIDVTIPAPKAAAATAAVPASPAAIERGRAIFTAAQKAIGGAERLRSVRDVSTISEFKFFGPQGEMPGSGRTLFVMPSALRTEQNLPFGTITIFYDGSGGWMNTPQGLVELDEQRKRYFRAEMTRNNYNLLKDEGEHTVAFEKRDKVGEKDADVIVISTAGETVRLFVDPASGLLLKKSYRGMSPFGGMSDVEETYSGYGDVQGFQVPHQIKTTHNGRDFLEIRVKEAKINSGLKAEDLAKKP